MWICFDKKETRLKETEPATPASLLSRLVWSWAVLGGLVGKAKLHPKMQLNKTGCYADCPVLRAICSMTFLRSFSGLKSINTVSCSTHPV